MSELMIRCSKRRFGEASRELIAEMDEMEMGMKTTVRIVTKRRIRKRTEMQPRNQSEMRAKSDELDELN